LNYQFIKLKKIKTFDDEELYNDGENSDDEVVTPVGQSKYGGERF